MLTPPKRALLGWGYISIEAMLLGEEVIGKLVMGVSPQVVTGSPWFIKNLWSGCMGCMLPPLLPLPLPEDSDRGRRKGSKSMPMPEVEEGIVCIGGPGVLGLEEDLPLELLPGPPPPPKLPLPFARCLCFLYLT